MRFLTRGDTPETMFPYSPDMDEWEYYEAWAGGEGFVGDLNTDVDKKAKARQEAAIKDPDFAELCAALNFYQSIGVIGSWTCYLSTMDKGKFCASAERWSLPSRSINYKRYNCYDEDPVVAMQELYDEITKERT